MTKQKEAYEVLSKTIASHEKTLTLASKESALADNTKILTMITHRCGLSVTIAISDTWIALVDSDASLLDDNDCGFEHNADVFFYYYFEEDAVLTYIDKIILYTIVNNLNILCDPAIPMDYLSEHAKVLNSLIGVILNITSMSLHDKSGFDIEFGGPIKLFKKKENGIQTYHNRLDGSVYRVDPKNPDDKTYYEYPFTITIEGTVMSLILYKDIDDSNDAPMEKGQVYSSFEHPYLSEASTAMLMAVLSSMIDSLPDPVGYEEK